MNITNIHRYLADEMSLEERVELEEWVHSSEKNRKILESYRRIYDIEILYKHKYDTEKALDRLRRVMDGEKRNQPFSHKRREMPQKRKTGIWLKVAAVFVIAAGLSIYLLLSGEFKTDEGAFAFEEVAGTTISTMSGEQKSLRLQDGSRVQLNADSEIFISEGYGTGKREVQLTGEAFFKVETIPGSTFEVQTETALIEVLGTRFGVRAWKEREESVIAVQTGTVSVRSADPSIQESVLLESGQISSVEINKAPAPATEVNIDPYIGWTRQQFVFDDTPLRDVLKQLELQFNVTIIVDDSSTLNDPVTARYRDESLEEILEYTSITHGVEFGIEQP